MGRRETARLRSVSQAVSFGNAVFAAALGLSQLATLSILQRCLIGTMTVACGVGAARFYRKSKTYSALGSCANMLRQLRTAKPDPDICTRFRFAPASTEAQYLEVCQASSAIYESDYTGPDVTLKWWRRFPAAVFAAYSLADEDMNTLSAYLSMWPISATAYRKLRAGKLKESEIDARSIHKIGTTDQCGHCYVANIVIKNHYRNRPHLLKELLVRGMRHWIGQVHPADTISLLAAAYSSEGRDLLARCGFRSLGRKTLDGWDLYEVQVQSADIPPLLDASLSAGTGAGQEHRLETQERRYVAPRGGASSKDLVATGAPSADARQ